MIHLNVQASDASQLAALWEHLRGCTSTVDIVDGDMHITVDLADRAFLALVEQLPAETEELADPQVRVPFDDALEYAIVETGTEDLEVIRTPEKPKPVELHLRRHILTLLADAKQPAKVLAEQLDVDVATVKAELAGLREEGLVRLAGGAGWALTDETADPIKRTPVDADAARRRAAEAM